MLTYDLSVLGLSCVQVEKCLVAEEPGRGLRSSSGERKLSGGRCRLSAGGLGGDEVSRRAVRSSGEGGRAVLLRGHRRKRREWKRARIQWREVWSGQESGCLPQRLEGGGLPGPPSSPLTLRAKIMDEEGLRGSCSLVIQHCRQDFQMNPNYWHLSVFWANRPAVTVDNET